MTAVILLFVSGSFILLWFCGVFLKWGQPKSQYFYLKLKDLQKLNYKSKNILSFQMLDFFFFCPTMQLSAKICLSLKGFIKKNLTFPVANTSKLSEFSMIPEYNTF